MCSIDKMRKMFTNFTTKNVQSTKLHSLNESASRIYVLIRDLDSNVSVTSPHVEIYPVVWCRPAWESPIAKRCGEPQQ